MPAHSSVNSFNKTSLISIYRFLIIKLFFTYDQMLMWGLVVPNLVSLLNIPVTKWFFLVNLYKFNFMIYKLCSKLTFYSGAPNIRPN